MNNLSLDKDTKNKFAKVFNPYLYLFVVWIFFGLSLFDNKLGWGDFYKASVINYTHLFVFYSISYLLGCLMVNSKLGTEKYEFRLPTNVYWRFVGLFAIVIFFTLMKFVNIRDIPLIGDPFSRYKLTLGGFVDFPTRLLTPLSLASFYFFKRDRKVKYLFLYIIGLCLHILYLWRQEVLNLLIGAMMISSLDYQYSFRKLLKIGIGIFVFLFLIVGIGGVARFSSWGVEGIWSYAMAIIHGELTAANKFGAYVLDQLGNDYLMGKYSFGSLITIVNPSYEEIGAEYLRKHYTNADTAQSIGVPFSYYVDFGWMGILLFGFLNGYMANYFYKRFIMEFSALSMIIYILVYLQLMFSIRSGNFTIGIFFMYLVLGLLFVFVKQTRFKSFSGIFDFIFIGSIVISFLFLLIRF